MLEEIQQLLRFYLVQYLPEPHGSLLLGILLGQQSTLSNNFYNALINTGTIHVVAASGFNTTIVAKVLLDSFSQFLPKKISIILACLGIILYTWVSGGSPSVVRAAIMSIIAYIALYLGREYLASWCLFITIILMILLDYHVVDSLSFWLSVTSTGGILWLTSDVQSGVSFFERSLIKSGFSYRSDIVSPNTGLVRLSISFCLKYLKSDFEATTAAQIATLPIILIVFSQTSLISPLVNTLILWLVPIIMLLGVFKLIMGAIWNIFGYIWGMLVFLPLEIFINAISLADKTQFGLIKTGSIEESLQPVVVFLIYMIYLVLFITIRYGKKCRGNRVD